MEARLLELRKKSKIHQLKLQQTDLERQTTIKRNKEAEILARTQNQLNAIPERFKDKLFNDYDAQDREKLKIKTIASRYVETFSDRLKDGTCMQLIGNPGTGKTMISLIMYQALIKSGYTAHYESSTHFLKKIQDSFFESYVKFQREINRYQSAQLLIIDEVTEGSGKQGYLAEWERKLLFTIINQRYENKRCTMVISNRDQHELIDRLGVATVERLSQKGIVLAFCWASYRTENQ